MAYEFSLRCGPVRPLMYKPRYRGRVTLWSLMRRFATWDLKSTSTMSVVLTRLDAPLGDTMELDKPLIH